MVVGKVYIGSMNLYGPRGEIPQNIINVKVVNVTSSQAKNNIDRITFSPMQPIDGKYKGFYNFEAYWQSGKVFKDIPHSTSKAWWLGVNTSKRRYPNSRGKEVLHSLFNGEQMNYVTSRKKVYVPEYADLVQNSNRVQQLKTHLLDGGDIVVYDYDGPRTNDGKPTCVECTLELLKDKINDTTHPFGHGYVVAAILAGIQINTFIQ